MNEVSERISYDDWVYYRSLEYWEPLETACLLCGILPEAMIQNTPKDQYQEGKLPNAIDRIMTQIERACRLKKIEHDITEWASKYEYNYLSRFSYFINQSYNINAVDDFIIFYPVSTIEWAAKAGLNIPPELQIEEVISDSEPIDRYGKPEYRFKELKRLSNTGPTFSSGLSNPLSADIEFETPSIIEAPCLTRTEAQELGRLRKEKERWDESLKAAVLIGHWVDSCKTRVTKKQIEGILHNHFPKINKPTIINHIWQSLPINVRNTGTGNYNEPMPSNIWPPVRTELKEK